MRGGGGFAMNLRQHEIPGQAFIAGVKAAGRGRSAICFSKSPVGSGETKKDVLSV